MCYVSSVFSSSSSLFLSFFQFGVLEPLTRKSDPIRPKPAEPEPEKPERQWRSVAVGVGWRFLPDQPGGCNPIPTLPDRWTALFGTIKSLIKYMMKSIFSTPLILKLWG